jgi:class 3 adenylate cyclase
MTVLRSDLPAGTVTFLFTDVEGSTQLLHELGAEGYAQALSQPGGSVANAFAPTAGSRSIAIEVATGTGCVRSRAAQL